MTRLTENQIRTYRDQGYVIVSDLFNENQLQNLSESLMAAIRRDHGNPEPAKQYTLITNVVEDPNLAEQASHPAIVDAAQALLGEPVVLSTFVAFLKTPGAKGTEGDYGGSHPKAHQDYKPYHNAGSSLNWLFAIMPLIDLDEETGPLFVSPGSHKLSRVVDNGERVRHVERASAADIPPLVDSGLRRGDLLLMNMFTWHEGGANRSDHNRLGIYNKYRAVNAPPAFGPIVFSETAHRAVVFRGRSLLPHYSDRPIATVRLILERNGRFLLMGDTGRLDATGDPWSLPGGKAKCSSPQNDIGKDLFTLLDNRIRDELCFDVPWVSYIGDFEEAGSLCRVFACALADNDSSVRLNRAAWFTNDQITELASQGRLAGGYEKKVIDLWLDPLYLRGVGQSKEQAVAASQGM